MKDKITFFLLFITFTLLAQTQGRITYKVIREIDKNSSYEKMIMATFKDYETMTDEFVFYLDFNQDSAVFHLQEKLFSNKYAADVALNTIEYLSKAKHINNKVYTESDVEFGEFLIERAYPKWKLLNETKKIGDFVCYKAEFTRVISNENKVFEKKYIAWYTPKTPLPYGPSEYGGLPGVILELQAKGFTYGATKITLDKEFKLPELKKSKIITYEKFDEILKSKWEEGY